VPAAPVFAVFGIDLVAADSLISGQPATLSFVLRDPRRFDAASTLTRPDAAAPSGDILSAQDSAELIGDALPAEDSAALFDDILPAQDVAVPVLSVGEVLTEQAALPHGVTFGDVLTEGWTCASDGSQLVVCTADSVLTASAQMQIPLLTASANGTLVAPTTALAAPAGTVSVLAPVADTLPEDALTADAIAQVARAADTLSEQAHAAEAIAEEAPAAGILPEEDRAAVPSVRVFAVVSVSLVAADPFISGQPAALTVAVPDPSSFDPAATLAQQDAPAPALTFGGVLTEGWTCAPDGSPSIVCTADSVLTAGAQMQIPLLAASATIAADLTANADSPSLEPATTVPLTSDPLPDDAPAGSVPQEATADTVPEDAPAVD